MTNLVGNCKHKLINIDGCLFCGKSLESLKKEGFISEKKNRKYCGKIVDQNCFEEYISMPTRFSYFRSWIKDCFGASGWIEYNLDWLDRMKSSSSEKEHYEECCGKVPRNPIGMLCEADRMRKLSCGNF